MLDVDLIINMNGVEEKQFPIVEKIAEGIVDTLIQNIREEYGINETKEDLHKLLIVVGIVMLRRANVLRDEIQ